MDPRLSIIDQRLKGIKRIIAVSGGKGGTGKSSTSSILSLMLSKAGYKVGLLDLDFYGPSTHIILGIDNVYPKEEKGIVPPEVHNIKFISIIYYAKDNPLPIRSNELSDSIIELLAITQWGELDFLIIDMPPGTGDTILDVIKLIKRIEFLIVTTQSVVSLETVKRMIKLLREIKIPIIGAIENMTIYKSDYILEEMRKFDVPLLGVINLDKNLESAIGNVDRLVLTDFAMSIDNIITKIV